MEPKKNSGIDPFDILPWSETLRALHLPVEKTNGHHHHTNGKNGKSHQTIEEPKQDLNDKVSLYQGDICEIQSDAIVNPANKSLLGGAGLDGQIHAAAGPELKAECTSLHGCLTGEAKITKAYRLPCKFVLHTVGPIGKKSDKLANCYTSCLELLKQHKLRTCAIPPVATDLQGYPRAESCKVACETVRQWLDKEDNSSLVDRVIFCVEKDEDMECYEKELAVLFPPK